MPVNSFVVRGDQIIVRPTITGGVEGHVNLNGYAWFTPEVSVRITADGIVNGEMGEAGNITKIELIDVKGNVFQTYLPTDSNDGSNVDPDFMGDDFALFNLDNFKEVTTGEVIGLTGDIGIVGCEFSGKTLPQSFLVGDELFDINKCHPVVPCFVAGHNRIMTKHGNVPIEMLAIGDLVLTKDNGYQPIRFMSYRKYNLGQVVANPKLLPYLINGDTFVSRNHRLMICFEAGGEYLMSAKHLSKVSSDSKLLEDWCSETTYINLFFDEHEIIKVNDSVWAESGFLGGKYSKQTMGEIDASYYHYMPARYVINHKNEVISVK